MGGALWPTELYRRKLLVEAFRLELKFFANRANVLAAGRSLYGGEQGDAVHPVGQAALRYLAIFVPHNWSRQRRSNP